MVDHHETRVSRAPWLVVAAIAVAVLMSGAATQAQEDTPYMTITAWQKQKLAGTEFSTSPIQKKGEQYFLVRRVLRGELFEPIVKRYCEMAGIDAEGCNGVKATALLYHKQEHTHANWQLYDKIYLTLPPGVYPPGR